MPERYGVYGPSSSIDSTVLIPRRVTEVRLRRKPQQFKKVLA